MVGRRGRVKIIGGNTALRSAFAGKSARHTNVTMTRRDLFADRYLFFFLRGRNFGMFTQLALAIAGAPYLEQASASVPRTELSEPQSVASGDCGWLVFQCVCGSELLWWKYTGTTEQQRRENGRSSADCECCRAIASEQRGGGCRNSKRPFV